LSVFIAATSFVYFSSINRENELVRFARSSVLKILHLALTRLEVLGILDLQRTFFPFRKGVLIVAINGESLAINAVFSFLDKYALNP
jgi:hypothetical protein